MDKTWEDTKKTAQSLAKPVIEVGKTSVGSRLHEEVGKHSGVKGKIIEGIASLLKKEGWYK